MSYIIKNDFKRVLNPVDLDRLTAADDNVWLEGQKSAIEEASSYLRNRYDSSKEFRDIVLHVATNIYAEGDRVYTAAVSPAAEIFYVAVQAIPANTVLTDTAFWTKIDDRNQKLISVILIIILYENYTRLNGSEIPQWLSLRYDGGDPRQTGGIIGYLKNIQKGTVQINLPLRAEVADGTTQNGNRIAYGVAVDTVNRNTSI